MWLITPELFISVVAKGGDDVLMVRARERESLENFMAGANVKVDLTRIVEGGGTDYPFRVTSDQYEVAEYFLWSLGKLDYPNFKNKAKETRGEKFATFLGKIWNAGWDLTPADVRARELIAFEAANPHYYTNKSVLDTNLCELCGKKLARCKCTDAALEAYWDQWAMDSDEVLKDIAYMTDKEFQSWEKDD